MPWKAKDAKRHNKKAKSPKRKRQWAKVANAVLERTGDEGRAVRSANSAVKKSEHKVKHEGKGKVKHRKRSKKKSVRKRVSGKG